MRIAALYDIHGNLPALEAVMRDVEQADVDVIVIGGDVFPGPLAHKALDYLRGLSLPVQCISGNGEREVLACRRGLSLSHLPPQAVDAIRWNAAQLSSSDDDFLCSWPATLRLGTTLFCHATPRSDTELFTRMTTEDKVVPMFAGIDVATAVCGHTHVQFDRQVGGTRVVNAGSVGMPFEKPGAYWLLLQPGIELRKTAYDLEEAAARIRLTEFPGASGFLDNLHS